jgi:DNA mismatch endonuclease (patch repair protein)
MVANRRKDTSAEVALRQHLHRAGHRFRVDLPIRVPGRRPIRPDIVFTRARVAVFVDGCFWHGCPQHGTQPTSNSGYWTAKFEINRRRDREQTAALEADGWTVVRVWEHEPAAAAAERVVASIADYAASASGASTKAP